MQMSVKLMVL